MKNENVIKMARLMVGCKDITCEDCLSQSKKLFGTNKCALIEYAEELDKAGYRKQSETITFYKDPNIKDWAESEYAWCERPCNSNMSMRAIDKKGSIVGYASEHYWTWCDVKEVKKVSAIEAMRHFASKQSETVKEFKR